VGDVAIARGAEDGAANGEGVGQRAGRGDARFHLAIVTERDLEEAMRILARTAGDDRVGAADRVLAVERALRAAQNFDALDVEQVHLRAANTRVVDAIDVEADRGVERLQRVRLTNAADVDVGGVRRAAALND